jgi:serine/threonine protein kinase
MATYVVHRSIKKKYTFLSVLGNGSFAKVHLVNKNLSNGMVKDKFKLYAMKSISKQKLLDTKKGVNQLMHEIQIHQVLH